jgi:hypothetical protein
MKPWKGAFSQQRKRDGETYSVLSNLLLRVNGEREDESGTEGGLGGYIWPLPFHATQATTNQ